MTKISDIQAEDVLDLSASFEPGAKRDLVIQTSQCWTRDTFDRSCLNIDMDSAVQGELFAALNVLRARPLPTLLEDGNRHTLQKTRIFLTSIRDHLEQGSGIAVVNGIDTAGCTLDEIKSLFWLMGNAFDRVVATKWDGTMIYDVRDTRRPAGYGVRGSTTNRELSFHTDNAFGTLLPKHVGLYCIRQAEKGGASRVCSLNTVFNHMLLHHRPLLERLFEPMFYDRQAEHAATAPKVMRVPMFDFSDGGLAARLTPNLVRNGYDLLGLKMDDMLSEALDTLEQVLAIDDFSVQFSLKSDQMQFINNLNMAHSREAFSDQDNHDSQRHLLRTWYRDTAGRAYDG
ncbi:MAG: TauD/TfdA family dioxygenase [Sulfitobacter sp.]